jgi:hypothetical protein
MDMSKSVQDVVHSLGSPSSKQFARESFWSAGMWTCGGVRVGVAALYEDGGWYGIQGESADRWGDVFPGIAGSVLKGVGWGLGCGDVVVGLCGGEV